MNSLILAGLLIQSFTHAGFANKLIAFSSNLDSGKPCHRDQHRGADLFIGKLDPASGTISDVRLIDNKKGAQWFPALSENSQNLVYTTTRAGQDNLTLYNLLSTDETLICTDGIFGAFSDNANSLYFNSKTNGQLYIYDIEYHSMSSFEIEPPHHLKQILNTGTARKPALSPDKQRSVTVANNSTLWLSQFDSSSTQWSTANPLHSFDRDIFIALGPAYKQASSVLISDPTWVDNQHLILTVQAFGIPDPNKKSQRKRTTDSRLVLIDIQNPNRITPLILADFPSTDIQMYTCATANDFDLSICPGHNYRQAAKEITPSNAITPQNDPFTYQSSNNQNHPYVYMVISIGNYDSTHAIADSYDEYTMYRSNLMDIVAFMEGSGITWNLQVTPDFIQGVLSHEISTANPHLLANTGNLNILQYLQQTGVSISPDVSSADTYNYADAAYLLQQANITPEPVLIGYPTDSKTPFIHNWANLEKGIHGKKFGNKAFFKPTVIIPASGTQLTDIPYASGVWKPKTPDKYYEHNPEGQLIAAGRWLNAPQATIELIKKIHKNELPKEGIYTSTFYIDINRLDDPTYTSHIKEQLQRILPLRNKGVLAFVRPSNIPLIWADLYQSKPHIYGPFSSGIKHTKSPSSGSSRKQSRRHPAAPPFHRE